MSTAALTAGFTDPTGQAQRSFRAVLEALARPTRQFAVTGPAAPPVPLSPTVAAVALTLCDEETPVWLDEPLRASAGVAAWLAFHTGARVVDDPGNAAFGFLTSNRWPNLTDFTQGTDEAPHTSATLVVDVTTAPGSAYVAATGPGISRRSAQDVGWAPSGFLAQWEANQSRFPRGIDLILAGDGWVSGLPRTTTLVRAEAEGGGDVRRSQGR